MQRDFVGGAFKDAQRDAQSKARYLFVCVYTEENPRCVKLFREMEQDTELQRLLSERCLCWAANADTEEGYEHMTNFGVAQFPFVALGVRTRFVCSLQGRFSISELKAALLQAMDIAAPEIAKEVAFQAERRERDALRLEQERALETAMRIDKERAAKRAAEKAAKEAAEREAADEVARLERERLALEAAALAEAEKAEAAAHALETARAVAASALPDEPAADSDPSDVAHIKLMAINGTPILRRFRGSDPVTLLFALAEGGPHYDGQPYELRAGYPPKVIDRQTAESFRDVKALFPRAVVTVRPVIT